MSTDSRECEQQPLESSKRQTRATTTTSSIHDDNSHQPESPAVQEKTKVSRGSSWMESFEKLQEFQQKHHHCNVTKQDDFKLWRWVARQRGELSHCLTAQRRDLLDSIGFEWCITRETTSEVNWEMNFVKLQRFLKQGNPCSIAKIEEYDKSVGTWAANQRKRNQKKLLRADRMQRLKEIGFDFGEARKSRPQSLGRAQQDRWEKMFQRLVQFKEENGHVVVPHAYKKDHALALWVSTQRREYNKKSWYGEERSMREDRRDRLNAIGFVWDNLTKKKETAGLDTMASCDSKKKKSNSKTYAQTRTSKDAPVSVPLPSSQNASSNSDDESNVDESKVYVWEV